MGLPNNQTQHGDPVSTRTLQLVGAESQSVFGQDNAGWWGSPQPPTPFFPSLHLNYWLQLYVGLACAPSPSYSDSDTRFYWFGLIGRISFSPIVVVMVRNGKTRRRGLSWLKTRRFTWLDDRTANQWHSHISDSIWIMTLRFFTGKPIKAPLMNLLPIHISHWLTLIQKLRTAVCRKTVSLLPHVLLRILLSGPRPFGHMMWCQVPTFSEFTPGS